MQLGRFLGQHVSSILKTMPFKDWKADRTIESGLDEDVVQYVFDGHGLELRCDRHDCVKAIFLHSEEYGGFDSSLSGIPFSLGREEARAINGKPSAHSDGVSDPILGDYGPWDRFDRGAFMLHMEYTLDGTRLIRATLLAPDAVP